MERRSDLPLRPPTEAGLRGGREHGWLARVEWKTILAVGRELADSYLGELPDKPVS